LSAAKAGAASSVASGRVSPVDGSNPRFKPFPDAIEHTEMPEADSWHLKELGCGGRI
jgi:hypothetical protein